MLAMLWPDLTGEPRNAVARLGRVCFYGLAGLAALLAGIIILAIITSRGEELGMALGFLVIFSAPPYLLGRALCYILAGE